MEIVTRFAEDLSAAQIKQATDSMILVTIENVALDLPAVEDASMDR
jgi:hypothetical protein